MRKRLGILAAAVAALLLALPVTPALAEDLPPIPAGMEAYEAIISYDVTAVVQADTEMVITERIVYNPGTEAVHHGLIRDIVTQDELPDGQVRKYQVDLVSVSRDGAEVPYTQDASGGKLSLRIGDPDVAITGLHVFEITYRVGGALDVVDASTLDAQSPPEISGGDIELYWDFIGSEWSFPVYAGRATVVGPSPALAATCFAGASTDSKDCTVDINVGTDSATVFTADLSLANYGLTGVVGWSPSGFTKMPVADIGQSEWGEDLGALGKVFPLILLLAALACGVPVVMSIVRRRANAGVVPAETPVRYAPPEGLRPAQMQAGIDGRVDSRGLSATLLDLAARGHIIVKEEDARLFHSEGLELTWTGTGKDELAAWETALLSPIFKGATTAVLGEYDSDLAAASTALSDQLGAEASGSGRFNVKGSRPDLPYKLAAALGAVGLFASILVFVLLPRYSLTVGTFVGFVSFALLVGGVIGALITPRQQSERSAAFLAEVAGFRRLLSSNSADARRDFAQRINLPPAAILATFLPYAVILELEDTWVRNFPDVTPEQMQSYGMYVGSMTVFHSWSSGMQSNFDSGTTARSSGSGFSGGGGFGGGGGGGGGGGSF